VSGDRPGVEVQRAVGGQGMKTDLIAHLCYCGQAWIDEVAEVPAPEVTGGERQRGRRTQR